MHRLRSVKDVGLLLFLYCNSSFCFRASDSLTPTLDLCYCASFFYFVSLFSVFLISLSLWCQPGVGATALLVTTTVV